MATTNTELEYDPSEEPEDDTELVKFLRGKYNEAVKYGKRVSKELDDQRKTNVYADDELKGLSEKQRKALEAAHEGELTTEGLLATARELNMVAAPEQEDEALNNELDTHDKIAAATKGSDRNAPTGLITPLQMNEWPKEKIMEFAKSHPAEFASIRKGENVRVVGFNIPATSQTA